MKYKIKIPKKKNLSEIKIYFKKVGLGFILDYSNSNLSNYTPKDFIERELSAQKTVQILLDHYES